MCSCISLVTARGRPSSVLVQNCSLFKQFSSSELNCVNSSFWTNWTFQTVQFKWTELSKQFFWTNWTFRRVLHYVGAHFRGRPHSVHELRSNELKSCWKSSAHSKELFWQFSSSELNCPNSSFEWTELFQTVQFKWAELSQQFFWMSWTFSAAL